MKPAMSKDTYLENYATEDAIKKRRIVRAINKNLKHGNMTDIPLPGMVVSAHVRRLVEAEFKAVGWEKLEFKESLRSGESCTSPTGVSVSLS